MDKAARWRKRNGTQNPDVSSQGWGIAKEVFVTIKVIMLEFHCNMFVGISGLVNTHWVLKLETHPGQVKYLGNQAKNVEKLGNLKLLHQTSLAWCLLLMSFANNNAAGLLQ